MRNVTKISVAAGAGLLALTGAGAAAPPPACPTGGSRPAPTSRRWVYARCISGKQDEAKRRILEATRPDDNATGGH